MGAMRPSKILKRSVVLFRDRMVTNCLLLCSRGIVTPRAAFVKLFAGRRLKTGKILVNNYRKAFHNCRQGCRIRYNIRYGDRGRGDRPLPSFRGVRQHPVESRMEGQSGTMSLPWRNHMRDSSVAVLPLNDVRSGECGAGCGGGRWRGARGIVDAGTYGIRHSEAAGRGIPYGGRSSTLSLPWWNHPGDSSSADAGSE